MCVFPEGFVCLPHPRPVALFLSRYKPTVQNGLCGWLELTARASQSQEFQGSSPLRSPSPPRGKKGKHAHTRTHARTRGVLNSGRSARASCALRAAAPSDRPAIRARVPASGSGPAASVPGCGRGRRARARGSPRRRVPATAAARPGAWRRQRARGRGPSPRRSDGSRRAAPTWRVGRDPRRNHLWPRSAEPGVFARMSSRLSESTRAAPANAYAGRRGGVAGRGKGEGKIPAGRKRTSRRVPSPLRRGDLLTVLCPSIMELKGVTGSASN